MAPEHERRPPCARFRSLPALLPLQALPAQADMTMLLPCSRSQRLSVALGPEHQSVQHSQALPVSLHPLHPCTPLSPPALGIFQLFRPSPTLGLPKQSPQWGVPPTGFSSLGFPQLMSQETGSPAKSPGSCTHLLLSPHWTGGLRRGGLPPPG